MNIVKPETQHKDERRVLTQLLSANIKQVNTYDCQPCTLGNHYHEKGSEYFYVISGELAIGNEYGESVVKQGEVFAVYPQENHIVNIYRPTKFMTFLTHPFDSANPDLHKVSNG